VIPFEPSLARRRPEARADCTRAVLHCAIDAWPKCDEAGLDWPQLAARRKPVEQSRKCPSTIATAKIAA